MYGESTQGLKKEALRDQSASPIQPPMGAKRRQLAWDS